MSVSEQVPIAQYEGNGYQSDFWVPFKFLDAEDLVITSSILGEIDNGGYTVSGTVVTLKRTPAAGEVIAITRRTPAERIADYDETGKVSGSSLNDNFDRPIMILQEVREELDRCLKVPATQIEKPEADISEAEKLVLAHNENPDAHKNTFLSVNGGNITGKFVSTTQDNYAFNVNGHEAFFRVGGDDKMYLFVTGANDISTDGKKFRPFGVDFTTGRSFVNSPGSDSQIPSDSNDNTAANTNWVTENFFPRAGGELRGPILINKDYNTLGQYVIKNMSDSLPLRLLGGTSDYSSGLILSPADTKDRKAAFTLRAGSSTAGATGNMGDFVGTADGTLTWQGFYVDLGYPSYRNSITVTLSEVDGVWSATIPRRCWIMLSFQVFNKISNTDVRINGGLAARFYPNSEVLNPCLMLPVRDGDQITINHIYNQQYTCLLLPFVTYSKEVSE